MINIINQFFDKLVIKEIKGAITPTETFVIDSSSPGLTNPNFPESLNEFYRQVNLINISWMISTREKGEELKSRLKQDPWLKENFWDKGTSIKMLDEHLSGLINIQKLEDMLNPKFCKEQVYYSVIDNFVENEDPDNYIPFDMHWSLTACLKRENGKILDNIWITYMDAETMFDMGVTIEKYLDLCYKAKGFYYWQLVYHMQNTYYEDKLNVESMKRFLPMLFPHIELDLSDFGM